MINTVLCGNVIDKLKEISSGSVSCVVTSPPYWNLRNYKTSPVVWGGKQDCVHEWDIVNHPPKGGHTKLDNMPSVGSNRSEQIDDMSFRFGYETNICKKCGAWKGELGAEPDFNMFVSHLADVFDEVKRVLRDDGTLFVNLGDTYFGGCGGPQSWEREDRDIEWNEESERNPHRDDCLDYKDKCLTMVPYRFAIEMIRRGWILRNLNLWHKPSCMPSSTDDRWTVDFEPIFFFVKNKKYWFEQQREPHKIESVMRACRARLSPKLDSGEYSVSYKQENVGYDNMEEKLANGELRSVNAEGRNPRTVWSITTKPFSEAHFAVFPPELPEKCIKSGCPEYICSFCGKPREKIYDKESVGSTPYFDNHKWQKEDGVGPRPRDFVAKKDFKGYSDCGCGKGFTAGVVLDPFAGSGTTLMVARQLRRIFIGIELNPEYCKIIERRLSQRGLTEYYSKFGGGN